MHPEGPRDPQAPPDSGGEPHQRSGSDGAVSRGGAGHSYPERIGPFRILGLIGEGATGVVYEAEQERPQRRVALKIVRPGMVPASVLRRFELEYEILGRLHHPGIAQIYQAGVEVRRTARSRSSRWSSCAAGGSTITCAPSAP
jgi:serine/threonine protein kinase